MNLLYPMFNFNKWFVEFSQITDEFISEDTILNDKECFDNQFHIESEYEDDPCDVHLERLINFNKFMKLVSVPKDTIGPDGLIVDLYEVFELVIHSIYGNDINKGIIRALYNGFSYKTKTKLYKTNVIDKVKQFLINNNIKFKE
jgi:hypothetical protein